MFDPETYFKKVNSTGVYAQASGAYQDPYTIHQYGMGWCQDGIARFLVMRVPNSGYTVSAMRGTMLNCTVYDFKFTGGATFSHPYEAVTILDLFNSSYVVNIDSPTFHSDPFYINLSMGAFPSNYTGLDYYYGGQVIFQNEHNATWVTHTNDFSTYLNTTVYYSWPVNTSFNITDTAVDNINQLYGYEYWTNDTTRDGIYAYNKRVYSFEIRARGLDLNTLTVVPVSISSAITCNNNSWFYSVSGIDQTLVSPCQTNNTVYMTVSGWQPSSVVIYGVDTLNPTGVTIITTPANGLGWVNNYVVKFGAFDKFASVPVQDATVSVGGVTQLTGSNGISPYTLYSYDTANFFMFNVSSTYYLSLYGVPKVYDVQVSKTGYIPSGVMQVNLTSGSPSGNSSFLRTYNTQLELLNARLVVDVWWSDGLHYNGDTAVVRVGGNNNKIYLETGGILTERNYATSFPATFVMVDNRSSWTAVMNVTSGTYFDNTSIGVTNTVFYYFHDFYLPNSSVIHECSTDAGCVGSFCKSSVWYHSGHCVSGTCSYEMESCILCDDEAGCFNEPTNISCPAGLDSECYGSNYCVDSKYLASYKCASSKVCYKAIVACDYICDSVEDVCLTAPVPVYCDQSTTVGMLNCLQSGVMSFIGSTYNPMFTLLMVIALVIIVVSFLVLAFAGLQKVLR